MKSGGKETNEEKICEVIERYRECMGLVVLVEIIQYFCNLEVCTKD
jgi:hypothetical protein